LTVEEMEAGRATEPRLSEERKKWDANKNGTIELAEFIAYYKTRGAAPADPVKPPEEEKRAVVYRVGKLPKGLPAWFAQLDGDKDGQVGLYEWKASGKSVAEFMALDHNGDGFLTVEEVLRDQRLVARKAAANGSTVSKEPSTGSPTPSRGARGETATQSPSPGDQTTGKETEKPQRGNRRRNR